MKIYITLHKLNDKHSAVNREKEGLIPSCSSHFGQEQGMRPSKIIPAVDRVFQVSCVINRLPASTITTLKKSNLPSLFYESSKR